MDSWRVKFHYPRSIGNVEWSFIWAHDRKEAVSELYRDGEAQSVIRERGNPLRITARVETSELIRQQMRREHELASV